MDSHAIMSLGFPGGSIAVKPPTRGQLLESAASWRKMAALSRSIGELARAERETQFADRAEAEVEAAK